MKKYFVLYLAPIAAIEEMMKNSTEEDMKAGMEKWMKWMKDNESIFVDMGAPLGKTKRVSEDRISDAKNDVTGYAIVEAESHAAAAKLFEGHPHFELPGSTIDVLEVTQMPTP